MENKGRYDDILHLPRPRSSRRSRMSNLDRAAQFSPFAALTGYDAAIREEARLTWDKKELTEDEKILLDRKYRYLSDFIREQPEVAVTYFQPDAAKSGGRYLTVSSRVVQVSALEQCLVLADGSTVPFGNIRQLEIPQLDR